MGLAPYGVGASGNLLGIRKAYDGIVTDYSDLCVEGSYALKKPIKFDSWAAKAQAAFEVQKECEEALLHLAAHSRRVTARHRLCLSGGVALNSVANFSILRSGLFQDLYINPAASDAGIPLGAALYGYHVIAGRPRLKVPVSPYIGPQVQPADIAAAMAIARERCTIGTRWGFGKSSRLASREPHHRQFSRPL